MLVLSKMCPNYLQLNSANYAKLSVFRKVEMATNQMSSCEVYGNVSSTKSPVIHV